MTAPHVSTITATEMQHKSGQIIKRAYKDKEQFIVERDGYPVVAIIPIDVYNAAICDRATSTDTHET